MAVLIPHGHVKNPDNGFVYTCTMSCLTSTSLIMKFIVWIITDIHMELNDIHWEGCRHTTRPALTKMDALDRRKCFCAECLGQLVARRTFYEHRRRSALRKKTCMDIETIPDPFDADISSDDDGSEGSLLNPKLSSTFDNDSDSEEGVPSVKQPRIKEEGHDEVGHSISVLYHQFIEVTVNASAGC